MTPTSTPTPTPTNTPANVLVRGTTLIKTANRNGIEEEVKIPGMPIKINSSIVVTNEQGEFEEVLESTVLYTIKPALPDDYGEQAIEFDTIEDSGRNLEIRSPLNIEMRRNVAINGPVCLALIGGVEKVFFTYNNTTKSPIQVPLEYNLLNRIFSPAGDILPPTLFNPGQSGFFRDLSGFAYEGTYAGAWSFAGEMVTFSGRPPLCLENGDPDPTPTPTPRPGEPTPTPTPTPDPGDSICQPVEPGNLTLIWRYTYGTTKDQISLTRKIFGSNRAAFKVQRSFLFKRSAPVLAGVNALLKSYRDTKVCTNPPPTCERLPVNKTGLRALYDRLFQGTPQQLKRLNSSQEAKKQGLDDLLSRLPDELHRCR